MKYSVADIAKLGTILAVWAHPDDETWGMAGIMAAARQNGQRVVCITATHGDAGKTADEAQWSQASLKQIRIDELTNALRALGVSENHVLDYQDGTLGNIAGSDIVYFIQEACEDIQPDSIFTFEPYGITGHEDHKAISAWTLQSRDIAAPTTPVYGAIELQDKYDDFGKALDEKFDVYFNIDKPKLISKQDADIYFELPDEIVELKLQALRAHASQTEHMFNEPETVDIIHKIIASEHFTQLR